MHNLRKSSSSITSSSNTSVQDIESGDPVDKYSNKVRVNHFVNEMNDTSVSMEIALGSISRCNVRELGTKKRRV